MAKRSKQTKQFSRLSIAKKIIHYKKKAVLTTRIILAFYAFFALVMPWGCYIVLSFRNSLLSTTMLTLLIVAIVWDILTSLFLAKPIKCFIVNFRKIKEIENKKPLNNKQKEKIISLYKEISNQLTLIS